mmetsp:Transcript_31703/g.51293  ORF Transcript_31703/g.51293 Transcript_31703/m.51293 type:complete len:90 (+) Transcript_31703:2532-2801(+)
MSYVLGVISQFAIRFQESAGQGDHADAQFQLSLCYHDGIGVQANEESAIMWCLRAAQNNCPEAQYQAALFYHLGHLVTPDEEKVGTYFQ